jgi:predicted dehydrogenase
MVKGAVPHPPRPAGGAMTSPYRVGIIGCGFMGRAHSNAWRKVANFFPELERRPVLQAVCARDAAAVAGFADA